MIQNPAGFLYQTRFFTRNEQYLPVGNAITIESQSSTRDNDRMYLEIPFILNLIWDCYKSHFNKWLNHFRYLSARWCDMLLLQESFILFVNATL